MQRGWGQQGGIRVKQLDRGDRKRGGRGPISPPREKHRALWRGGRFWGRSGRLKVWQGGGVAGGTRGALQRDCLGVGGLLHPPWGLGVCLCV